MASPEIVEAFKQRANAVLEWKSKKDTLIRRPNWGEPNFEKSEPQIDRILSMTDQFSTLPIELIRDDDLNQLNEYLSEVVNIFNEIDRFTTVEMVNHQSNIASRIEGRHDSIMEAYRMQVPWLAVFSGKMELWTSGARDEYKLIEEARRKAEEAAEVAAQAARAAQESAGEAGATEFTAAFRKIAEAAKIASKRWLWAAGCMFAAAVLTVFIFIFLHGKGILLPPSTAFDAIIYLGWRVGAVGLLVFASVWCGKHYRAYRHNHEVSQHREACLENMRAFHHAVQDQDVRDMVVLEFSRAATQGMPTGFISGRAESRTDPSPQMLSLATRHVSSPGTSPQAGV